MSVQQQQQGPRCPQNDDYDDADEKDVDDECNCIPRTIVISAGPHQTVPVEKWMTTFNKSPRIASLYAIANTSLRRRWAPRRILFLSTHTLPTRTLVHPFVQEGVFRFLISYTIRRVFPPAQQSNISGNTKTEPVFRRSFENMISNEINQTQSVHCYFVHAETAAEDQDQVRPPAI